MPSLTGFKLLLLLNIPLSIYTTLYLASEDGLGKRLRSVTGPGKHGFPGTPAPLRQQYTGLPPIDKQLTMLVVFFAEAIDVSRPASVIQSLHFSAQFCIAGLLLALEGARAGNRGKGVTWTTLAANCAQYITFAITAPTYLLLHLLTTSSSGTSSAPNVHGISVSPAFAASIPFALTFGFVLPSAALMLPAPSVVSYDTHQLISAAWQVFPIYVAGLQLVFQELLRSLFPSMRNPFSTAHSKLALRAAYIYGVSSAALGHIGTTSLWMMRIVAPSLFVRSFPSYASVFTPQVFWPTDARRIKKPGEAATLLLQWDETCGSLAMFVWASALLWSSLSATKRTSVLNIAGAAAASLAATTLLGPCGAALAMVWARDELVWAHAEEKREVERKTQ